MKNLPLIVVVVLLSPLTSAQDAMNYSCSLADLTRRVEILAEPGVSVPCEVHYYKDTENPGEDQVLWSAQNEAGYCEARAAEFIERLRGMGWNCQATGGGEPEMQPDDTEALAPAEAEIEIPEPESAAE